MPKRMKEGGGGIQDDSIALEGGGGRRGDGGYEGSPWLGGGWLMIMVGVGG